jgi:hypothetical protein
MSRITGLMKRSGTLLLLALFWVLGGIWSPAAACNPKEPAAVSSSVIEGSAHPSCCSQAAAEPVTHEPLVNDCHKHPSIPPRPHCCEHAGVVQAEKRSGADAAEWVVVMRDAPCACCENGVPCTGCANSAACTACTRCPCGSLQPLKSCIPVTSVRALLQDLLHDSKFPLATLPGIMHCQRACYRSPDRIAFARRYSPSCARSPILTV